MVDVPSRSAAAITEASAVNDISRELGGTLGVALTGSIFISLYTPHLTDSFERIPGLVDALPPGAFDQAQDSVGAAYAVAQNSPSIVQTQVLEAVSDAFMRFFGTACLVVSAIAFVGSLFALRFLPARAQRPSTKELT